jgi:hypothetical protein
MGRRPRGEAAASAALQVRLTPDERSRLEALRCRWGLDSLGAAARRAIERAADEFDAEVDELVAIEDQP